jgi:hypothetical protein
LPATLYDFRDLDLMMRIADEAEKRITSKDLAEAIGLDPEDGGTQSVGIRLSWMKRYGFVQFDAARHDWTLSAGGRRITEAHLRAAQVKAIENVPDEAMVEVMSHVTSRYRLGDPVIAQLLRREFLFGTQRR